jgi:hypothetical protein
MKISTHAPVVILDRERGFPEIDQASLVRKTLTRVEEDGIDRRDGLRW